MLQKTEPYYLAMVVAERICRRGPVINYCLCASMLDRAGAHTCAALAREMPRDGYLGDALHHQFKREWNKFKKEIEQ